MSIGDGVHPSLVSLVDHLVVGTPDLSATIEDFERLFGVRATAGGRHLSCGTRNALLAIGPAIYLELLGPDPEQTGFAAPRWFGVDQLTQATLVAWAAKAIDLERRVAIAKEHGAALGAVTPESRTRAHGDLLQWTFTDPRQVVEGGVVPFFIDWGTSPHPTDTAAIGPRLLALRAEHPDPARVLLLLDALGVPYPVTRGERPALIATFEGPFGPIALR